jgi:hypothetical protein
VRLGEAPRELPGSVAVGRHGAASADAFLFEAPGVARYLVRGGAEVTIEPALASEPSHIRTYLLGSVLGALCYQRGLIPLHANALATHGRCIALAGETGAGKSTLAAYLSRRGCRVMGDDVCALSFAADGRVMVWPGARRFKLWADTLAAFGEETAGLEKVVDGRDKYALPHDGEAAPEPAPFEALYLLRTAADGAAGAIRQLAGQAAFAGVIANIYRLEIAVAMGRRSEVFAGAIEILRQASVFVFERRWGFDALAEGAARLERHIEGAG